MCVYVYVCVCVCVCMDFSGSSVVKNLPVDAGDPGEVGSIPVRKIPWRRKGQPTPVFSPEKIPWTEEPVGLIGLQRVGHD